MIMFSGSIDRRKFIGISSLALSGVLTAKNIGTDGIISEYKPDWNSLDSHLCPAWFDDAKLGMYFHWGLSSVPAWAPRSEGISYAEWYGMSMTDPKNPTYEYHRKTYGENFRYDDFIPMFKAEKYDPCQWVKFAKNCGMKYVFVNMKHHDGFCMWPTKYTDRNAYKLGPKRDLISPFVKAARSEGLKVGFYYSYYEWFNPAYTGKPYDYTGYKPVKDFVADYMVFQIREIMDLYQPDFIYFDGEWDKPSDFWKSREFISYYYNQAEKRGQKVLVNDRYGNESRGVHGDVFNVEYHFGKEIEGNLNHKWSYWRGVGKTFGYNKDTNPEDCLSAKELIHMVIDGVARNGNFDINVGPTAAGEITDVEREPLEHLGKWLKINGEAIYGTRPGKVVFEGNIRFTYKDNFVYAVFLKWPGDKFIIKPIKAVPGSKISMLGVPGELEWKQEGENLVISFPDYKPRSAELCYAWTLKIENDKKQ